MFDDFINNIVLIGIAFILPFFTTKSYELMYDKPVLKADNQHKLMFMIAISVAYIIVGALGSKYGGNVSMRGVSLGGLFLLISNIFRYWNDIDHQKQIFLLGVALSGLMYMGNEMKTTLKIGIKQLI